MTRILTLIAAALLALPAFAGVLQGRVVGIADGDTITVLDAGRQQHRIRLKGIDAPEKAQQWGMRAKQSLSDLVYGQQVAVEWDQRDQYGRMLGKVVLGGGDVNLEQIRRGMAWHYKRYAAEQSPEDRSAYASAEQQAQAERRGLWAEHNPVPPWDWRKANR